MITQSADFTKCATATIAFEGAIIQRWSQSANVGLELDGTKLNYLPIEYAPEQAGVHNDSIKPRQSLRHGKTQIPGKWHDSNARTNPIIAFLIGRLPCF